MRRLTPLATALLLLAAMPAIPSEDPAEDEGIVTYTNADVEKLEPLPTGRPLPHSRFDARAWEFVSAFIAHERAKITSDRDHDLERERVEIEADRPVGYGQPYPYDLRVPYGPAYHGQKRVEPEPRDRAPAATRIPHPMFKQRPPVREFTPGLGDSYGGQGDPAPADPE